MKYYVTLRLRPWAVHENDSWKGSFIPNAGRYGADVFESKKNDEHRLMGSGNIDNNARRVLTTLEYFQRR